MLLKNSSLGNREKPKKWSQFPLVRAKKIDIIQNFISNRQ